MPPKGHGSPTKPGYVYGSKPSTLRTKPTYATSAASEDRIVRQLKRRGAVRVPRPRMVRLVGTLAPMLKQHFPDKKLAYSDFRQELYIISEKRPGTPVEIQRGGGFFNIPAVARDFRDVAVESAVGIPALGQSLYHDPVGTLKAMPGAMAGTLARDLANPWEHPGRFLIAAGSLGTLGAGGAIRTTSAGRALAETGRLRSAITRRSAEGGSLLRKPLPGVHTVTYTGDHGTISVDIPLSKNPIMRSHQKFRLHRIQKALDEGHVPQRMPSTGMGRWLRENVSAQAKLGRERRARQRPLIDVTLAPAFEAEPALSWVSKRTLRGGRRGYRIDPVRNTALAIVGIFGDQAFTNPAKVASEYATFYRQQAHWLEGVENRGGKGLLEAAEREVIAAEGALRYLEARTPELLAAAEAARRLSTLAENELIDIGFLAPERAAGRLQKAAGVFTTTRVERPRPRTFEEAEARLGQLEGELEHRLRPLVDESFPPKVRQAEQAIRNVLPYTRGKRAARALETRLDLEGIGSRKGGGSVLRDAYERIEERILELASRENPDPTVLRVAELIEERNALRETTLAAKEAGMTGRSPVAVRYEQLFGHIVDVDDARQLVPRYARASKEERALLSAPLHEQASRIAKEVYADLLRQPPRTGHVRIMGGGPGAGKTEFRFARAAPADVVLDTTLSNLGSASARIDEALASGRTVTIFYIYRDPVEALTEGVVRRAREDGRTVPLDEHVRMHVDSNRVIGELAQKYAKDDRVQIRVFANTAQGTRELALSDVPRLDYSEVADATKRALHTEIAAGRVPAYVAQGIRRPVREGRDRAAESGGARGAAGEGAAGGFAEADELAAAPIFGEVIERVSETPPGAFFFTMAPQVRNAIRQRAVRPSEPRPSEYGIAPPAFNIPGLRREFTGESFTQGPPDIPTAIQDRFLRVMRFRALLDSFDELWEAGSDVRRSEWDIPLRHSATIRDDLRKIVKESFEEFEINPNLPELERGILPADKLAALKELITRKGGAAEGVRWIDRRFLKDLLGVTASYKSMPIVDAINNFIRVPVLFLRPAYALNALGNTAMGFVTQGPLAPRNFWLGAKAKQVYGVSRTAKIDAAIGESRALAYTVETGMAAKASRKLARGWSRLADSWFRRSAFIHHARKQGFEGRDGLDRLFQDRRALAEVSRRARKDAVDFDSLTPLERNTLKHIVFFYPWSSRGSAWAVRAGVEHPLFALTALELSERGDEYLEENFPEGQPSWAKLSTLSPFGRDRAQTLGSVWTPSTAASLGGLVGGVEETEDVLTPAAKLARAGLSGRWMDVGPAGLELLENLPQVGAARRSIGESTSKTFPGTGLAEGLGPFLIGGLYPRRVDKAQLARQAAREKSSPEKAVYNTRQSRAALKADIERLRYTEPESVRTAWRLQEQFDREVAKHDSYRAKFKGALRLARRLKLVSPYVLRTYVKRADEMTEDMNESYLRNLGDSVFGGRVLSAARSVVNEALRAKGLEPTEAERIDTR